MNEQDIELSSIHRISSEDPDERETFIESPADKFEIACNTFILGLMGYEDGKDMIIMNQVPKNALFIIDKVSTLSTQIAIEIVRESLAFHKDDVNFGAELYRLLSELIRKIPDDLDENSKNFKENESYRNILDERLGWELTLKTEAALIKFHSPYPEVRAITDPEDAYEMETETLRAYIVGVSWTIFGSIINNFFIHKLPSLYLGVHTIQLLLLPTGKFLAWLLPEKTFSILNWKINLNPGPWTQKEMMLCTIMYSCSSSVPYSIYSITVMKLERFYGLQWVDWKAQCLLALSTQFLGFGFAGITRRAFIYPEKAIWPSILPTVALNRALMSNTEDKSASINGWTISRYRFFCIVFIIIFFYHWIPNFFFTALSTFNWPTWFNPSSVHLVNITGFKEGLGLNPFPSLDWNIIDSGGCLTYPFYKYFNEVIGSILGFFVILIVYYTNSNWTGYMPINSNQLFNNKGSIYKVQEILNDKNLFDPEKYNKYGPPYFSAANVVLYGAYFCMYPFSILYYTITEWGSMKSSLMDMWETIIKPNSEEHQKNKTYAKDVHYKMMLNYEEVPDWWFLCLLSISIIFAVTLVVFYPTETPVWTIFLVIVVNFLFLLPITAISSTTGFSFGLNVLVELMVGYIIPNSGIALITLKSFGYNIDHQASNYISDQKLAHYSKVAPKAIFRGQVLTTLINTFIALIIANWQIENIENLCDPRQKNRFSCPGANTYFYSSIQYGEIGPAKVFTGSYPILKWCFLLGALLVLPCYLIKVKSSGSFARYFHPTIIIGGFLNYAPFNLSYSIGGLYLSYIFMHYLKDHYFTWWAKYNYILTSALSAGVAFSALLIFFLVQNQNIEIDWWGNRVADLGIEGGHGINTWLEAKDAPDGYFGLRKGNFP